jgi:hypothetical protein
VGVGSVPTAQIVVTCVCDMKICVPAISSPAQPQSVSTVGDGDATLVPAMLHLYQQE